jgi:hypothetical protein
MGFISCEKKEQHVFKLLIALHHAFMDAGPALCHYYKPVRFSFLRGLQNPRRGEKKKVRKCLVGRAN